MTEEAKGETEPIKYVEAEPAKEAEPIPSEPLKETKNKTNKIPTKKNIKVIPLASELDHGLIPEPKKPTPTVTPEDDLLREATNRSCASAPLTDNKEVKGKDGS